jgi:hypothetical protein
METSQNKPIPWTVALMGPSLKVFILSGFISRLPVCFELDLCTGSREMDPDRVKTVKDGPIRAFI